ncbi:MAG: GNAT family N-acetyltransferase [Gammaproteobacteria bacterium]|nr:GNAT family N-acetyltransferase [Gammaproteobacteria bacterium]
MQKYNIKELSTEEFSVLWDEYRFKVFDDIQIFSIMNELCEDELAKVNQLRSNMGQPIRINLGVYHGDEFIGWSWGFQESHLKFYMCNSAILPKYRRRGLYTMLVQKIIERAESYGFQEIYGRHAATNNGIIIPKLKLGFLITGIEISDAFGSLVHLSYFPKKIRKKMLDYRSGLIKPDDEIKRILKL